jgi:hypothetical protein
MAGNDAKLSSAARLRRVQQFQGAPATIAAPWGATIERTEG